MPPHTRHFLSILAVLALSSALRFRSNTPHALDFHIDTTCGTCHSLLLEQFQPLWRDQQFQDAMTKFYNISFWSHTITRHPQTFTLNLALDCAFKHFPQADFVDTLLSWEATIEPWAMAKTSHQDGGSGPSDRSITEVDVKEDELLEKSVPKHEGFDGVPLVKTCLTTEINETVLWVKQHTPEDFHEVPLVIVDGIPHPEAVDDLKSFLCSQMGHKAPASCPSAATSASLLERSGSLTGLCEVTPTTGHMLLQESCGMSKMPDGLSEREDPSDTA